MYRRHATIALAMALMVAGIAGAKPRDSGEGVNVSRKQKAAFGADVVAYFALEPDADAVMGSEDYAVDWKGATWLFSTQMNVESFTADPERYAPQYGGYCSMAMSQDQLAASDPDAWALREGRLYLFNRKKGRKAWLESPDELVRLADGYWPPHLQRLIEEGDG